MAYPGAVPASVGKRVLAYVIDALAAFLLGGAFLGAGSWQVANATGDDGTPAGAVALTLVGIGLLGALGLTQWWYHGRRGATLGKALVGLRTVDADTGQPIGMGRALVRALVVAAGSLALGIGQLVVLASPLFDAGGRRQGWHDKAARALLVDVVTGVDPVRARASEAAATARLDGLLAPVAVVDLGPATPAVPPPPPPPPAVPGLPTPADRVPSAPDVAAPVLPTAALPDSAVPTAPDYLAPYPAAVPPPPAPGEIADLAAQARPAVTPVDDDDRTGIISAVPGVRPVVPGGPPPLEPTILVDHVPEGLAVPASAGGTAEGDGDAGLPVPVAGEAVPLALPGHGVDHGVGHGVDHGVDHGAAPVGAGPAGVAADGASGDEDLDDLEATRLSLTGTGRGRRRSDGPARAVLRLWSGEDVTLTGFALLGRNPVRRDDEPLPEQVITVPDQRRSVSKTHLSAGVDVAGLWVRDRGSTNGTVITLPDGAQVICAPGQQVRVPVGATVSFGDFWFTVG